MPSLTNGNAEQKGTSLGSVVEYSCDFGFELSGPATRECQAVGAWANTAPICEGNHDNHFGYIDECVDGGF